MCCEQAAKGKQKPKELTWGISFNLVWKEQSSCLVKKITEQLKESLNSMKIVRTWSDTLWCSRETDVAFASVWQIHSLVLPLWRVYTPFAADYVQVWYVMQLNLQILAHTHWTIRMESHFG